MRIRILGVTVAACCLLRVTVSADELSVGDPAPGLHVSRWIRGEKIERFQPGKVYVIGFWATWCGPCIDSFPQLTRLQKKYSGKGVTVIGVSIWEDDQGAVEAFVKARGDAMGFSVALDLVPVDKVREAQARTAGKMAEAWMSAAGKNLIPAVFIVGRDGKIAWIGGPRDLDEPLDRIVAGQWYKGAPDKEIVVSPAPAPIPALRVALLPLDSDRTPGDAAPIYLRLRAQMGAPVCARPRRKRPSGSGGLCATFPPPKREPSSTHGRSTSGRSNMAPNGERAIGTTRFPSRASNS